jgi:16S rRNA (adenine1518-N6/adenine1519-N6)-dimethyltransferase
MSTPRNTTSLLPRTPAAWRELLEELGVRPTKGRGQNFLFERGVVARMVEAAGIGAEDVVVEIGPGLGILTEALVHTARRVIALELEPRLAAHLQTVFAEASSFEVVEGDALLLATGDLLPAGQPYQVIANLPYSVGSAVIRRVLEQPAPPTRSTVMVQREVAERLTAKPPRMSILSVATQYYATPRLAFTVAPTVFIPRPKVESAVVVLDLLPAPRLPHALESRFFRILNAGFRHRRKQLANSLSAELALPKELVNRWLAGGGIDPARRAETLSVEDWVSLTHAYPEDVAS